MSEPFRLDAAQAEALSREFGTPLYVLSESVFLDQINRFQSVLASLQRATRISFATKSNGTLALIQLAHRAGCKIDVASEGELRAALRARIPAGDCTLHGNNKSREEIALALEQGIGEIVIDALEEIAVLAELGAGSTELSLRLNPSLTSALDPKVDTGSRESKFGFPMWDGSAAGALAAAQAVGLNITGVHCHLGSQILDEGVHALGAAALVGFMKEHPEQEWRLLNVGGGYGIRYTEERPADIQRVLGNVAIALSDLPELVTLAIEPGRSLVGDAGLTLYTVGVCKWCHEPPLIAVDGGLADNPRPALYGARYTVEDFVGGEKTVATIVGRHCENDVLFPEVSLCRALKSGDLIQVLSTGAYSSSMASNYNRYPRPATVLLRRSGEAVLVQRRESFDEMLARDITI